MCEGPVHNFMPHGPTTTPDLSFRPIIHKFIPNSRIRECPPTLLNDMPSLRLIKRPRTASHSASITSAQLSSVNKDFGFQVPAEIHSHRWSLNDEKSPERRVNKRENHWHSSENKLAGKRKMHDLSVNVDADLENLWPVLSETSDEDDNHDTSGSDSEAYSGPS